MRKWLRKLLLSEWLNDYAFKGLKPGLDLKSLTDKNLKEYSAKSKEMQNNPVFIDIVKILKHRYESKVIREAYGDDLFWCRAYLKIIEELELLVEHGVNAYQVKKSSEGLKKPYR